MRIALAALVTAFLISFMTLAEAEGLTFRGKSVYLGQAFKYGNAGCTFVVPGGKAGAEMNLMTRTAWITAEKGNFKGSYTISPSYQPTPYKHLGKATNYVRFAKHVDLAPGVVIRIHCIAHSSKPASHDCNSLRPGACTACYEKSCMEITLNVTTFSNKTASAVNGQ